MKGSYYSSNSLCATARAWFITFYPSWGFDSTNNIISASPHLLTTTVYYSYQSFTTPCGQYISLSLSLPVFLTRPSFSILPSILDSTLSFLSPVPFLRCCIPFTCGSNPWIILNLSLFTYRIYQDYPMFVKDINLFPSTCETFYLDYS